MKKLYKILIVYLAICILSINIYAKDTIYQDETIAIVNDQPILKSEFDTHKSLLLLLINNLDQIYNLEQFTLSDMINVKLQTYIANKQNIKVSNDEIKDSYTYFKQRTKLSELDYYDLLKNYNITQSDMNNFLKENIAIEKLHDRIFRNITVSRDELNDFVTLSNNNLLKYQSYTYKVIRLTIDRKINNKKNLYNIKLFKNALNSKKKYGMYDLITNGRLGGEIEVLHIDPAKNEYEKLKDQIKINPNTDTIGPIFNNNKIEFLKVISKKSKLNEKDTSIKIGHVLIKKHSNKLRKTDITILKNKIQTLNKIKKYAYIEKNNRTYEKQFEKIWLHANSAPEELYKHAAKLEKNEVSEIIETSVGWHLIKVIHREYDPKSHIYNILSKRANAQKTAKARDNWLEIRNKEAHIKKYKK